MATSPFKYSTVLDAVQLACVQLGLGKPVGVYDSQDEHAVQMGVLINNAGIVLSELNDWEQLVEDLVIPGDGVEMAFPLADNFSRIIPDTGWDYSIRRPVVLLSPQQWSAAQAWVSSSFFANPVARIRNNALEFLRPPTGTVKFQYVRSNWVIDADDPAVLKYSANKNGDRPMHDWLLMVYALKVLWSNAKGIDSTAATAEMNFRLAQLESRNRVGGELSLNGGTFGNRLLDGANLPNTGYG